MSFPFCQTFEITAGAGFLRVRDGAKMPSSKNTSAMKASGDDLVLAQHAPTTVQCGLTWPGQLRRGAHEARCSLHARTTRRI